MFLGVGYYGTSNMDLVRNKSFCKPVKLGGRAFSLSSRSSKIVCGCRHWQSVSLCVTTAQGVWRGMQERSFETRGAASCRIQLCKPWSRRVSHHQRRCFDLVHPRTRASRSGSLSTQPPPTNGARLSHRSFFSHKCDLRVWSTIRRRAKRIRTGTT